MTTTTTTTDPLDAGNSAISCSLCGATHPGTRGEARHARWEPFSNKTQWLLDNGADGLP